jgi:septal ring factor EnvC (AmiA/AmiB activator)
MKTTDEKEQLYTLKQLRQAWGAGKAMAYESFDDFIEDEVENEVQRRVERQQEYICLDCAYRDELQQEISILETENRKLKRAIVWIDEDLQRNGDGRVCEEIRRLL